MGDPASEAGSYLRLIDSCITQLKAQGPSRTCNESKEEEKGSCLPKELGGGATRGAYSTHAALEATQWQMLSQTPSNATSSR